jgi:hypothetical protein
VYRFFKKTKCSLRKHIIFTNHIYQSFTPVTESIAITDIIKLHVLVIKATYNNDVISEKIMSRYVTDLIFVTTFSYQLWFSFKQTRHKM